MNSLKQQKEASKAHSMGWKKTQHQQHKTKWNEQKAFWNKILHVINSVHRLALIDGFLNWKVNSLRMKWSGNHSTEEGKSDSRWSFVSFQRLFPVNDRTMREISLKIHSHSLHPPLKCQWMSEKFFSCWLFLLCLLFMFNGLLLSYAFFLPQTQTMFLLRAHHSTRLHSRQWYLNKTLFLFYIFTSTMANNAKAFLFLFFLSFSTCHKSEIVIVDVFLYFST